MEKTSKPNLDTVSEEVQRFFAEADLKQLINTLEILTEQLRVRAEKKRIHLFLYHKETVPGKNDEISKVRDAHAALYLYDVLRPLGFQLEDTILNKPATRSDASCENNPADESNWKEKIKNAHLIILPCRPPIASTGEKLERVRRSNSWLESQILNGIKTDFVEKSSREQVILALPIETEIRKLVTPDGWSTEEWRAWLNVEFFQQQREYGQIHGFPALRWKDAPHESQKERPGLANTTAGYLFYTPNVSKECEIALLNVFGLKGNDTMIFARKIRDCHADLVRDVVASRKKRAIVFKMSLSGEDDPGILYDSCCVSDIANRWTSTIVYDVELK